jgi:hypothetical protein
VLSTRSFVGDILSELPLGAAPSPIIFRGETGLFPASRAAAASLKRRSVRARSSHCQLRARTGTRSVCGSRLALDPRARGTNRLTRDGATLAESAQDVLAVLEPILGRRFREIPASTSRSRPMSLSDADTRSGVPSRTSFPPHRSLWTRSSGRAAPPPRRADYIIGAGTRGPHRPLSGKCRCLAQHLKVALSHPSGISSTYDCTAAVDTFIMLPSVSAPLSRSRVDPPRTHGRSRQHRRRRVPCKGEDDQ